MRKTLSCSILLAVLMFAGAVGNAQVCNNICDWDFDHCTSCSYDPSGGNSACSCMSDGSCHFILCGGPMARNGKGQCTQARDVAFQSTSGAQPAIRLAYFPLPDSPLRIIDEIVSGGGSNVIRSAMAHNTGNVGIRAFRIGLLIVSADRVTSRETISEEIAIPKGAKPQSSFVLPAIKLVADTAPKGALVAFYVAEVKFASGRAWTADLQDMKSKLTRNSSRAGLGVDPLRLSDEKLMVGRTLMVGVR